jgi:hypothetical protein
LRPHCRDLTPSRNGVVGNWAIYKAVPGATANHYPLDWLSGRTPRRTLADIQQYDEVVWASGTPIGMIESPCPVSSDSRTRIVGFAESLRGGRLRHAATTISMLRTPTATPRRIAAPVALQNGIHRNDAVVMVSKARGGR